MSGTPSISERPKPRSAEWEKLKQKIIGLQGDLNLFKSEFFDREKFKQFAYDLFNQAGGSHNEICITGYFSETIRKQLESLMKMPQRHVRLICPHFPVKSRRDKKNLQALKKLEKAGAKIRVNNRLHARFLVCYMAELLNKEKPIWRGLLLIGSFDFNTECIGMERYDAGIKTSHPDLIESAVRLFDEIWSESAPLLEKYSAEIEEFGL